MPSSPPPVSRRRALIAPLGFLVLLLGLTTFLAINYLVNVRQSRSWVLHSHAVIETAQALFTDVLDVESCTRGYLGSGDARVLDHYDPAMRDASAQMSRLHALVADNPNQKTRVDRLVNLSRQRLGIADMRVRLMKAGRVAEARSINPKAGKV